MKKTMKKNDANIYLFNDNSNPCLQARNYESQQYMRTFSKQGNGVKISLKQTPGAYQPAKLTSSSNKAVNQSIDTKDDRSASLGKHEHRFKFMMDNLYY
jgi:hypothetical protein